MGEVPWTQEEKKEERNRNVGAELWAALPARPFRVNNGAAVGHQGTLQGQTLPVSQPSPATGDIGTVCVTCCEPPAAGTQQSAAAVQTGGFSFIVSQTSTQKSSFPLFVFAAWTQTRLELCCHFGFAGCWSWVMAVEGAGQHRPGCNGIILLKKTFPKPWGCCWRWGLCGEGMARAGHD